MKVTVNRVGGGPVKFSEFLERNGLDIEVQERAKPGNLARYWCRCRPITEVMKDGMLGSPGGNGETPAEAIADLARAYAGERLAIRAYHDDRREVQCPNEWLPESDGS